MEKIAFSFKNRLIEFEVRKVKRNASATSNYGKIVWQVVKVNIPGSAIQVGDLLPTRRVFLIAKDLDPSAAHAFDMENQG